MNDLLPAEILERRHPTALFPLYRRGIEERDDALCAELLEAPDAIWSRFVDRDWLLGDDHGASLRRRHRGTKAELVLWSCLSLELWLRRRRGQCRGRRRGQCRGQCSEGGSA